MHVTGLQKNIFTAKLRQRLEVQMKQTTLFRTPILLRPVCGADFVKKMKCDQTALLLVLLAEV